MNNTTEITAAEVEKELKEALAFGFSLAEAIDLASEDGKINAMDFPLMIAPLTMIGSAIEGIGKIKGIGKLDAATLMSLVEWAKNDLDLRHDPTEEKVEAVLEMIVRIYSVYAVFKK